jgi:electron transport complex protein RnfB
LAGILTATLVLGGLGLIFGILLTIASNVFAPEENPLKDAVRAALPGANCGGCGYPGCDGLAAAIAQGKAPVDACPVGGKALAQKLAEIMDVPVAQSNKERLVAQIEKERCIGCGLCKKVCQFNAITGELKSPHEVKPEACTGCSQCVAKCPQKCIKLHKPDASSQPGSPASGKAIPSSGH